MLAHRWAYIWSRFALPGQLRRPVVRPGAGRHARARGVGVTALAALSFVFVRGGAPTRAFPCAVAFEHLGRELSKAVQHENEVCA